jgi:RHS repeat-associated protein
VREHQHYQGPFHPDKGTAVWHHQHDELNGRIGTVRPDGHRTEWLTYGAGHVHGLLLDGQELVAFERDALYQETSRTQANGLRQTMKYDPAGRLIEQQLGPVAQVGQKDRLFYPDMYRPDVQVGMRAAIVRRYRYDPSGQLASVEDNRRGHIEYRYDPVGRLLAANSAMGYETFAFDPAGNIQVPDTAQQGPISQRAPLPKLLDNLLKEYAGVSYRYDERGNLVERTQHGKRSEYAWDAFNRMTRATTSQGVTTFAYDPLGRRIAKHSQALDGGALREPTRTTYGWDGDTMAFESSVYGGHTAGERTIHYVYERDSFVPLVQATRSQALRLAATTDVKALMACNYGKYDVALDPLWNGTLEQEAERFGKDEIAFYQCDHLGTPLELTDHKGKVAWSAQYRAWGQAKEVTSEAGYKTRIRNPIRFQGQYEDEETGLFYNRYRYYDPNAGRYLAQDSIGLRGGVNLYIYAPNSTAWIDPLGLTRAGGGKNIGVQSSMILSSCACSCKVGSLQIYHRKPHDPTEIDKVLETQQVRGRVTRNYMPGLYPKVKAYEGRLPTGAKGYEFTTEVLPDVGHVPKQPTWSGDRPGVIKIDDDWAGIKCKVTKVQR